MKKIKYLIVSISILCCTSSFKQQNSVKEIIRSKIENGAFSKIVVEDQLIQGQKAVAKFYLNRFYEPAWINQSVVKSFLKELEAAHKEGLSPNDYHLNTLLKLVDTSQKTPYQEAELDLLMTDAFLLYTSHLLTGKVDQEKITARWSITQKEGNPIEILEEALGNNSIQSSLENIKPKHKIYKGLKIALEQYTNLKKEGGWQQIPDGEVIKLGEENARIPLIRARLVASNDLSKRLLNDNSIYDQKLFDAVKQFQLRHGNENDGQIGKHTIALMNSSIDHRINQIKINLERWRWLSQKFGNYYIKVNIADFTMEVIKNGNTERLHKVITGKLHRKTPVFSSIMTHLVLNPTWTVPPGILNADILPAVRKNVNYLKTKNLIIYDSKGNSINPNSINFTGASAKSYSYVQPSGPDNALGAVKFMFPNKYSVYLHDTPAKELFEKSERAFSSGCIRVQNPLELAEYILRDNENWNLKKINQVITTRKTQTVPLKQQVEVHLLYWTAWTDDNGILQFRNDIYERDAILLKALQTSSPKAK